MTQKGYEVVGPGEEISWEMTLNDAKKDISSSLEEARNAGLSDQQVKEIIRRHARQIKVGETHMGEEPPIVKEVREAIEAMVENIWLPKKTVPPKR
jgi:hypothetical protein